MQSKFILRLILIISIFFSLRGTLLSCSCTGEAYFCHEITDSSDEFLHPEYVFLGIKLKDTLHGMFVRIERQYINGIEEDTILIWGDPGHLCRVYASEFAVGDTVIFGIRQLEYDSGMPQESIGDYWLPTCGITFLKINNGVVEGPISMDLNAMPLAEFNDYMDNQNYENDCMTTGTEQNRFENNNIKLYPNPAGNLAFISCENCEIIDDLTVFNASGQEKNIRFVKAGNLIQLDLGDLEKGIYFIKFRSADFFKTHKFLIL